MKLDVTRVNVWAASIKDEPGGLAGKLDALAEAGANLEFVIARREAKKQKFAKTSSLHSVRVEGPDKAGLGAAITKALADACVNLRGLSAAAIGRKFVMHFALDSSADATKAIRALKKL